MLAVAVVIVRSQLSIVTPKHFSAAMEEDDVTVYDGSMAGSESSEDTILPASQ